MSLRELRQTEAYHILGLSSKYKHAEKTLVLIRIIQWLLRHGYCEIISTEYNTKWVFITHVGYSFVIHSGKWKGTDVDRIVDIILYTNQADSIFLLYYNNYNNYEDWPI